MLKQKAANDHLRSPNRFDAKGNVHPLTELAAALESSAEFVPDWSHRCPQLSVVITAHNEGGELLRTVKSVAKRTETSFEVVVVDDGSTDESCSDLSGLGIRLIQHQERVGVAYSRNAGCAAARGNVLAFLDGHQRLSRGCLDRCARLALQRQAVVWPDVRKLGGRGWTGHGARFQLCPKRGYFSAKWILDEPSERVAPIHALMAPGYVMPRAVYDRVGWVNALRGWGGSEAAIGLKAFFLDVPLVHACGPVTYHLFRGEFPYQTSWDSVWRNHALLARVCFSGDTWHRYWLPNVFERHLTRETQLELESAGVKEEHAKFQERRVRSDDEFWTNLLNRGLPAVLQNEVARATATLTTKKRETSYAELQPARTQGSWQPTPTPTVGPGPSPTVGPGPSPTVGPGPSPTVGPEKRSSGEKKLTPNKKRPAKKTKKSTPVKRARGPKKK